MAKRKPLKLQEIQDLLSELSDVDGDGADSEYDFLGSNSDSDDNGIQSVHIESSDNEEFDENNGGESSDEEYNIVPHNIQKRRRMRLSSSSEEENTTQNMQVEVAADGTIWKKIEVVSSEGYQVIAYSKIHLGLQHMLEEILWKKMLSAPSYY